MLSGLLIYTAADAARNQWFIQECINNAKSERISLRLCLADNKSPADVIPPGMQPDFVINRSRIAAYSDFFADERKIPVFNNPAVTRITNDKYLTHCFLRSHGIPAADTVRIDPNDAIPDVQLPAVIKPPDEHGGKGVQWVEDRAVLQQIIRRSERPLLIQQPMQIGWDLRVYIMGGAVYAAVLRTSDTDFRSNFSLGGQAALCPPDAGILSLVQQIQNILPLDYAGIDFLRSPSGSYVVGEIEDAVGCRMLYQLTDKNPAQDYIRYIRKMLR